MNKTWLDPEECAYNTDYGGHSRSLRRGRALCPDGKLRKITAGVHDTFFTVPCHTRIRGQYASGFLACEEDGFYIFTPYDRYKHLFTKEA